MASATNQAWQFTRRGQLSDTLELKNTHIVPPKQGEITIQVHAVAVNPVDGQLANSDDLTLRIMGVLTRQPKVPAFDVSGIVHLVGKGVTTLSPGDQVFGLCMNMAGNGCLQKYVTVPLNQGDCTVIRKPTSLDFVHAASIPLVFSTVHTALVRYGKLGDRPPGAKKRSVLVLGGSGGTGNVAIQLAKQLGCTVVTTCSQNNIDFVKKMGADEVIDYTTRHVPQAVLQSPHAPFSVILDCVGGTELIPYLDHLIVDDPEEPQLGIYVTIVGDKTHRDTMGGPITNIFNPLQPLRSARGRLCDLLPWWTPLRSLIAGKRYVCIILEASVEQFESIPTFIGKGGQIILDSVYSFEDAREAYKRLESGRAVGKIVIKVVDDSPTSSSQSETVAYLGPEGSYGQEAALRFKGPEAAEFVPQNTISKVFESNTDFAVVPFENTIRGIVQETLQGFCGDEAQLSWEIIADTDLSIQHTLVVRKGTKMGDVTWVGSHEQALGQCSNYLLKHFPLAKQREFDSTAKAASYLAATANEEGRHGAAICSTAIAEKLGDQLDVVGKGIQNVHSNHTRFLLLRRRDRSNLSPPSLHRFWTLDDPNLISRLAGTTIAIHSRPIIREGTNHAMRYLVETIGTSADIQNLPGIRHLGSI